MEVSVNHDMVNQINERREKLTKKYSEIKIASDEFIKGTNHPDGAFHSFRHFSNVAEAAKMFLTAAQTLPVKDPTNFWGSYEKFCDENKLKLDVLDKSDLETSIELFGMIHDLGNAFTEVNKTENGLEFIKLTGRDGKNQFQRTNAEDRFIKMTETIVRHFLKKEGLSEEKQKAITKLVQALTSETTFKISDRTRPFALFARMVDQIGQALVDPNKTPIDYTKNVQKPLLDEEYYDPQKSNIVVSRNYGNFVSVNLPKLCDNDIDPVKILEIFGLKEIPHHLIYEDGDPRLKELELHPLHLRQELYIRLDNNISIFGPPQPQYKNDLQKLAGGLLHEILAEIELREGREIHPFETEILKILQNPSQFGFRKELIPRNPDLIKLTYDDESGVWTITGAYDAKKSNYLDYRCLKQLSSAGIEKAIRRVIDILNMASVDNLTKRGLGHAAKMRAQSKGEPIAKLDKDFTITIVIPKDVPQNFKTVSKPKKLVHEFQEKLRTGKIKVQSTTFTSQEIKSLSTKLIEDYKVPTSSQQR